MMGPDTSRPGAARSMKSDKVEPLQEKHLHTDCELHSDAHSLKCLLTIRDFQERWQIFMVGKKTPNLVKLNYTFIQPNVLLSRLVNWLAPT